MHPNLKFFGKSFLALALGLICLLSDIRAQDQVSPKPASHSEQQSTDDNTWHISLSPYLWFAGVHGEVGVLGHESSVHASPGDVLSYLNLGAMGALEARYNRIVVPIDFLWIKLSDDKGLPFDQGATSVKVKMYETIFTPKIGYRLVDKEKFKVDTVFGVRYWHLKNSLNLQPTQIAGGFSASANWVDAVAGAKFEAVLTPKVVLTVLGDAGGGGARSDYQVAGLLGYRLNQKWILQAGYRYLDVNYRPQSTFVYNAAQSGVLFGATINLK